MELKVFILSLLLFLFLSFSKSLSTSNNNLMQQNFNNIKVKQVYIQLNKVIARYKDCSLVNLNQLGVKNQSLMLKDFNNLLKNYLKLKFLNDLPNFNSKLNSFFNKLNLIDFSEQSMLKASAILSNPHYVFFALLAAFTFHMLIAFNIELNSEKILSGEKLLVIAILLPLLEVVFLPVIYGFIYTSIFKLLELKIALNENNLSLIDIYGQVKSRFNSYKIKNLESKSFDALLKLSIVNYNKAKEEVLGFHSPEDVKCFINNIELTKNRFKELFLNIIEYKSELYEYLFARQKLYKEDISSYKDILNYHKDLESNSLFKLVKEFKVDFKNIDLFQIIFAWSNIWNLNIADGSGNSLIDKAKVNSNYSLIDYLEKNYSYINDFCSSLDLNELINQSCSICLEESSNFRISCGHKFHKDCIKEWLSKSKSCPTCRVHIDN